MPFDPRYLAGVAYFNCGEYYDAHEVWEDLWRDCDPADRLFFKSLIQAAVAIYHWENRNVAGAARLAASGRRYMAAFAPAHLGLDVAAFWAAVDAARGDPPGPPPRIALHHPPGT